MNYKKWKDWRLNALQDKEEISDNEYVVINESYHHLNTEAKLGLTMRQMNKHLREIEKSFDKALLSTKVNEAMVETWSQTYNSLKLLDERIHTLMDKMKGDENRKN